ncbi:MAG TPA: RDD family protein, partial [Rhodanobacteraceae bacterium]|nr:RDD family protein [Rhodanobacteraceae bacterium]
METKYALVLTGSTLPGFAPETVWPALAAYFRMEPAKLTDQVLVRAPLTIKESEELGKLQTLQAGAAAVGAEAEICAPDGRPALFVLLDGTPRGPVPRVFVEERVEHGLWPDRLMIAEVGSNQWRAFRELSPAAPAMPAEEVAAEPDIATATSRPAGYAPTMAADHGHNLAGVRAVDETAPAAILPAGETIHAGFWRRVAAYFIDSFIVGIAAWIVGVVLILGVAATGGVGAMVTATMLNYVVMLAIYWLYFALQESSATQATLGKRAFGLKVTDDRAHRISFGRATGRFFGKFVSSFVLGIGYLLAAFTERKQALHDMMASTFVVFREVEPGQPLPATRPPMPWYGWVINILCLSIVPIAILAAIALPAFFNQRDKANDAKAKEYAHTAEVAMETCATENGGEYTTCSPESLKKIEPTLNSATIEVPKKTADEYELVSKAPASGNAYTVTNVKGALTFT